MTGTTIAGYVEDLLRFGIQFTNTSNTRAFAGLNRQLRYELLASKGIGMSTKNSLKNKLTNSKKVSGKIQTENTKYDKVDAAIDKTSKSANAKQESGDNSPGKKNSPGLKKMTLNYTREEKGYLDDLSVRFAITGSPDDK
jgi:hypothetical protein